LFSDTLCLSRVDISEQVQDILTGTQAKSVSFLSCAIVSEFPEIIDNLFSSVISLERLHAKHVLPGFTDRTAEEREIEAVTTDITKVYQALHFIHRTM